MEGYRLQVECRKKFAFARMIKYGYNPLRSIGAWRSPASALAWGARGRRFKSSRPDSTKGTALHRAVLFFHGLKRNTALLPSQHQIHLQPCLCSVDLVDILHGLASCSIHGDHLFSSQFSAWHSCPDLRDNFTTADPPAERNRPPHGLERSHHRRLCFCLCAVHVDRDHLDLFIFTRFTSHTTLFTKSTDIKQTPSEIQTGFAIPLLVRG